MVNEYKTWSKETLVTKGRRLKELIPQSMEYAEKFTGDERTKIDIEITKAIITLHALRKEYKNR